jgi:aerobic carbon-monoxide dehydrogenase large subunit
MSVDVPVEPRYVGQAITRREDPRFLLGRARYVDDVRIPGTLHAAFVRTDEAHARIIGIDTSAAEALDGVVAVLTGPAAAPHWAPIRYDSTFAEWQGSEYWPLANDKVRFVGEAVAVVVARDRYVAEDAAELIDVEYEALPPVPTVDAAMAPGAPLIHEHWDDNWFLRRHLETEAFEDVMSACPQRRTLRLEMGRHSGQPMETRGCVAEWDDRNERLVLHCSTQAHFNLRTGVAEVLRVPEHQVQVIAPDVGGGFGIKHPMYPEEIVCSLLAKRLRRPVKWIEDRREHMLTASHSREHYHDIEVGFDDDGVVQALRARIVVDCGAYSMWPLTASMDAGMALGILPGPYRIRNYLVDAWSVSTNKCPLGAYRGVSRPAACFTIERTMDAVAEAVGIDGAEVRRRNLVRADEFPYTSVTGMVYDSGSFVESLEKLLEEADYAGLRRQQQAARAEGRYLGIGVATYTEQTAHTFEEFKKRGTPITFGFETSEVEVDPSGHVTVRISAHSHGQGLETSIAQVAADALGVDLGSVRVRFGDTTELPYGMGTFASRSAVLCGGSTRLAADDVRGRMARIAAHLLEAAPEDIVIEEGKASVRGTPAASVSVRDIAQTAYLTPQLLPPGEEPLLSATRTYDAAPGTGTFSNAALLAVVEVDVETGGVAVQKVVVVEDCGRIINPLIVDGQIRGGVAQGIGTALFEEYVYDDIGQLQTTTFMHYIVPGSTEVPDIEIHHLVTPSPFTILGIKGMGEGGAISPGALIAAAVEDAIRPLTPAHVHALPIRPDRVRAWIEEGSAT